MYFQAKLRPDFHRFTSAVLDWLEKRPEIDADRIGIIGRSLGGFYAVHSAAHDPRFKACVCWGVLFDLSYYDQMRDPARRGFAFVAGYDDAEKAGPYLKSTLDLSGQAERVRCPVYALHGAQDMLIPATQVDRLRKAMAAHPHMTSTYLRMATIAATTSTQWCARAWSIGWRSGWAHALKTEALATPTMPTPSHKWRG